MSERRETVVGFLGFGNIGGGVWNLLTGFADELEQRSGTRFRVKKAVVRDLSKQRGRDLPAGLLTTDPAEVLDDPEIGLVCEFLGGEQPAADWMIRALKNGKTVVTANKVALALDWDRIQAAAEETGAGLYYEASVCGAIPVISTLLHPLQSNRITSLMGIINGTTNYILSRMSANGESYAEVLRDAQKLGLAEPDPASDVEGMDAAYKLSILASLAFHTRIRYQDVYHEGISEVSLFDIKCGRELGYTLKLLAIGKRQGDSVEVRVHPTFLPDTHPLAMVNGSFNAVWLNGHACTGMMLQGVGAGGLPTASAVVGDMLQAVSAQKHTYTDFPNTAEPDGSIRIEDDWKTRCYVRLSAVDRPGVLSEVAGCFAAENVSIRSMIQKDVAAENGRVPVIFMTHPAAEQAVQAALRKIDPAAAALEALIRVED